MTIIIVFRSEDGVVLGADSIQILNTRVFDCEKMIRRFNIVFTCCGYTNVMHELLFRIELITEKPSTLYGYKKLIEKISKEIHSEYGLEDETSIYILGLENITTGNAMCFEVLPEGSCFVDSYATGGSGSDLVYDITQMSKGANNCEYNSKRAAYCIFWASDLRDFSVGGKPSVFYLKNNNMNVFQLSENQLEKIEQDVLETKELMKKTISGFLRSGAVV